MANLRRKKLNKANIMIDPEEIYNAVKNIGLTTHSLNSLSTNNHSTPQLELLSSNTKKNRPPIRISHTQPNLTNSTTQQQLIPTPNINSSSSPSRSNSPHSITESNHSSQQSSLPINQPSTSQSTTTTTTPPQPSTLQSTPPQQQQQPSLPTIKITGIEPSIDYTQAIDDILQPPPNFTTPSCPPPVGSQPAAPPSDISFGYLGRPNSPPPSYPQHPNQSQPENCQNHNNEEPSSFDFNSDWDLNLSLQDRISRWLHRRGCSQDQESHSSTSPVDQHVQSKNIVWIPIRLVMDDSYASDDENEHSSDKCTSTMIQTEKEETHTSVRPADLKGKKVDTSDLDTRDYPTRPIASNHKGKGVDRGEETYFEGDNLAPDQSGNSTDPQPSTIINTFTPRRPLPPLPPPRLHRQTNVKLTRKPPPPLPPKREIEKTPSLGTTRRPPPLPPKRRVLHEGSSPSVDVITSPTALPASPAEVNKMLRRGSSIRFNKPIIPLSPIHHNHHQRHLSLSGSENLVEEELAFNRRSLPVIVESNSFDYSSFPASPSFVQSTRISHEQQQQQEGTAINSRNENQDEPRSRRRTARVETRQEEEGRNLSDYTELDLLLLRIERSRNDGNDYEDLNLLQEILGGVDHHHINHTIPTPNSSTSNQDSVVGNYSTPTTIQSGTIQITSKRTDQFGKVKLKFSLLGHQCNKCIICLHQFKQDQRGLLLPCTHVFHHECIVNWLKIKQQCPLCKTNVF